MELDIECEVECTCMIGLEDGKFYMEDGIIPIFTDTKNVIPPFEYTFSFCPLCGEEL